MCQECHQIFCPAACPNCEPDKSPRCIFCGEILDVNDSYTDSCGNLYCPECINECDIKDILWICGCKNVMSILIRLGALKKYGDTTDDSCESSVKKLSNKCSL